MPIGNLFGNRDKQGHGWEIQHCRKRRGDSKFGTSAANGFDNVNMKIIDGCVTDIYQQYADKKEEEAGTLCKKMYKSAGRSVRVPALLKQQIALCRNQNKQS